MAEGHCLGPGPENFAALTQEAVEIVGLTPEPLPHLVDRIVSQKLKEMIDHV